MKSSSSTFLLPDGSVCLSELLPGEKGLALQEQSLSFCWSEPWALRPLVSSHAETSKWALMTASCDSPEGFWEPCLTR